MWTAMQCKKQSLLAAILMRFDLIATALYVARATRRYPAPFQVTTASGAHIENAEGHWHLNLQTSPKNKHGTTTCSGIMSRIC
jgi:hypothetical protein